MQIPSLRRLHVAIHCKQVQDTLHFPSAVPRLIYEVSHIQTSIVNLSFHATCQMTYVPGGVLLVGDDDWQLLAASLRGDEFSGLSSLRMSISAFLHPEEADLEVTREMCEEVEKRFSREFAELFECRDRQLSFSIAVQSLREVFSVMEEWH